MLAIAEPLPQIHTDAMWIEPWIDDIVDSLGHDPKSPYVERFWLGLLGPSATWLIRSISYGFDASPTGFHLSTSDTARVLGIGERTGKYSPAIDVTSDFVDDRLRVVFLVFGRQPIFVAQHKLSLALAPQGRRRSSIRCVGWRSSSSSQCLPG